MTAADKYYLKAKDCYPYEIEDALEALEYGLSHDDSHAPLLALKGEIYYQDLKRFPAAIECFELALYHDAAYVGAYYNYIKLLCEIDEMKQAEKMISRALGTKGIDRAKVLHLEAMMYEQQGMYTIALSSLNSALFHCRDKEDTSFYTDEIKRVKKKSKSAKSKETVSELESVQVVGA